MFTINLPLPKSVILIVRSGLSQKCLISGEATAIYRCVHLLRVAFGLVITKSFIVSLCSNSSTVYESGLGVAN